MTLDRWDDTAKVTYDHAVLDELCSLRFVDAGHNAVIMGPVGVGKTFLATALGHAAVRRRYSVTSNAPTRLLKRLRAVPARQQPRRRDPQTPARRPAHPRRLRPPALDAARHRRHLRAHRRTPPRRRHRRHLQPGTDRMARPDGRPPPRPISHRPAPVRRLRTRPRRRVLPATPKASHHPGQQP